MIINEVGGYLSSLPSFSPKCPSTSQENDPRLILSAEGQVDFSSHTDGHRGQLHKTRLGEANRVNILGVKGKKIYINLCFAHSPQYIQCYEIHGRFRKHEDS